MSCFETLKSHGLKLTPQRRLIIEIIHDKGAHLTAEQLISDVQSRMPGVNKSTIYRTLELFEASGCVYKSELEGQTVYHHAEEGHHHHLVCSNCGRTFECDEQIFAEVEGLLAQNFGFTPSFKHQIIKGLCSDCRSKGTTGDEEKTH